MTEQITLPGRPGPLRVPDPGWEPSYPPPVTRSVYAAAHVAAFPDGTIDWESTMRFREHLWAHGFGLAEAMDTAQRGMGLSFGQARELIGRSAARASELGAAIACGAGTDQLPAGQHRLATIVRAYADQIEMVQASGSDVILMASRALAASARSAEDYLQVYGQLLKIAERPVLLHWLGHAFDPALQGYWGNDDFEAATDTVIEIVERAEGQVRGMKFSVLDAASEIALRRRLPRSVRLYTGDDFNYAELIRGDADGHSDALLGAFAAVTAPAAAALHALDAGDLAGFDSAMNPTAALSRLIFSEPTYDYKVGVAFLAWVNGLQPHFAMLNGLQERRSARHLIRVFERAAECRALLDPELAVGRMRRYLTEARAML
jgi:Protein of unknown function (DUF993)